MKKFAYNYNEDHRQKFLGNRMNWLRAGILGANDGIISIAGIVLGVAAATNSKYQIISIGCLSLIAGALSMAGGEYASVSSQKDAEIAAIKHHMWELETYPEEEKLELATMYQEKGLSKSLSHQIAQELTKIDALKAHAEIELGINPYDLTNPWQASIVSFLSFLSGGMIPLLVILIFFQYKIAITFCIISVILSLLITGWAGAYLGKASIIPSIVRNVFVGLLTMNLTYFIGYIFNIEINH